MHLRPVLGLDAAELGCWRSLAAESAEPNPFAEADLVRAAVRARGPGAPVLLLTVAAPDGWLLALPVLERHRWRGRIAVPAVSTWVHDYCFLGTPLLRRGREREALEAALGWLAGSRRAHWLVLGVHDAGGPAAAALRCALSSTGLTSCRIRVHDRAAAERLPDGSVGPSPLRGKHAKELRRQRRRLAESCGAVTVSEHRGDAAAVEAFLALEAAGWKGRSGTAMLAAGAGGLLRELVTTHPSAVRVLQLRAGSDLVAAQVNLVSGRASSCFKTAYDERTARWSPGALLESDVLEAFAADRPLERLDSCARAGHFMAERLFPDRRRIETTVVGLSPVGRAVVPLLPAAHRAWHQLKIRTRRLLRSST